MEDRDDADSTRDRDDRLIELARAVADGTPVDWSAAESVAATDSERLQIRHMRLVHDLASGSSDVPADPAHESILHPPGAVVPDAEPLPVVWGPLRVIEKIGRGRFGDVYRAWDPRLDREVALKLLRHRPADADTVGSSVIEEGRMLARIRHPNVVTIHGAERINDRVGLWMELIRGRTLYEELDARGPFAPAEVAGAGVQLLQALAAVHRAGLLHRDIKAQNVMRDHDGRLVLMDFGTGWDVDRDAPPDLAGTPLYLAPEVLRGAAATEQSDLYSLGVLLFLLASGRHPIQGKSLAEIRRAHESGATAPVRVAAPRTPAALARVIDRLTAPRPEARFRTASDAEAELRRSLASPSVNARSKAMAAIAGLAVVGVGAWLALAGNGGRVNPPAPADTTRSSPVLQVTPVPEPPGNHASTATVSSTLPSPPAPNDAAIARAPEAAESLHPVMQPPCIGVQVSLGALCTEWPLRLQQQGRRPPAPLVKFNFEGTKSVDALVHPSVPEQFGSSVASVDGRQAAFVVLSPFEPPEIRVVHLTRRDVRKVTQLPAAIRLAVLMGWAAHDGRLETLIVSDAGKATFGLVDPSSGAIEAVFEFDDVPQLVSRAADGRIVFDVDQADGTSKRDLRICQLATRSCRPLSPHPTSDGSAQWLPDGQILFVSDRGGVTGVWRIDPDAPGSEARLVRQFGRATVRLWGVSAAGVLALEVRPRAAEIYRADLQSDLTTVSPMVRTSRDSIDTGRSPAWSPDNATLAFLRREGVVIQPFTPLAFRKIPVSFDFESSRLAWSPDGRAIAIRSRAFDVGSRATLSAVRVIDATAGRTLETLDTARLGEGDDYVDSLAWLDDRRLMVATSAAVFGLDRMTGADRRIWAAPPDHRVEGFSVSRDRLSMAVVLAAPAKASRLVRVSLADGAMRELLSVSEPSGVRVYDWLPDSQSVLIVRFLRSPTPSPPRGRLWRVPVDGSPAVELGLEAGALSHVTLQANGQHLTFVAGNAEPELWLWRRTDFLPASVAGAPASRSRNK